MIGAEACVFAIDRFVDGELVNAGSNENVSIKELSEIIANVVNFNGEITWDATHPNGTPNRPLDSTKLRDAGWSSKTTLLSGLRKTYHWYLRNTYYDSCK